MKTFTIENDTNNITLHATMQDAEAMASAEHFGNEAGLAELASNWSAARLVDIWNSLPGASPVKKFTDRKTAVTRIWKAVQNLGGPVEPETAPETQIESAIVPELEAGTLTPTQEMVPVAAETTPLETDPAISVTPEANVDTHVAPQKPHIAPEAAPAKTKPTRAKKAAKTSVDASVPREGSKTSQVIAMLKREGGTTLEEIMTAMGWQKHTTRAMLSAGGSLTKNHGLVITSETAGDKRIYSIKG